MRKKLTRPILLIVIPAIALTIAGYFYITGGRFISTENAYVKAHLITISTDIDGRVSRVFAQNHQPVRTGDLLFRLDTESTEIQLQGMQAELANVENRIRSLRAQYDQSILQIGDADERVRFLSQQEKRQKTLLQQGHGSEAAYDQAAHDLKMGHRSLKQAYQAKQLALTELGGKPDTPTEQHPLYLAAQANLNKVNRQLKQSEIRSPIDGIVSNLTLQTGEYVETGEAIFTIVNTDEIWVEANLKESQLTHVRKGQTAVITVDAYPDVRFDAVISSLSPSTGAEFSILPPQNATGNWVKVVQRIPVRLQLIPTSDAPELRAGMTTSVRIDTQHERKLPPVIQSVLAHFQESDQHSKSSSP